MRLFVRAIRASAGTMLLDDGEGLAQRRRGAEAMGFSITSSESPSGARVEGCLNSQLSPLLSVSAPLRQMSAAGERLRNGDGDVATPFENGNGAAMSSSPWESLCNGDGDVATPFHPVAVSRCTPFPVPGIRRLSPWWIGRGPFTRSR
jgi:hypothetical protein